MTKKQGLCFIIPFLIIIYVFSFLNFISPDKSKSNAENRALSQKPVRGETDDKSYSEAYEKYYTDQFVFRDEFLKLYMKKDIFLNRTSVKGYYLLDDNWILQGNKLRLTENEAKIYSDIINEYGKTLKSRGKDVYYASIPQKENILTSLLPNYSNLNILLRNSSRFMSGIDKNNINVINVRDSFNKEFSQDKLKTFYFKTDNHWNSIGAYEGFKTIINEINEKSHLNISIDDNNYTTKYIKDKYFMGVYNQNLYEIYNMKETIPYVYKKSSTPRDYYLHNGKEFVKTDVNSIIAPSIKKHTLSYPTAYTSSNLHYKVINNSAPVNKKLLIYRDSYHSAMSWMYEDIFREVEVVDPRYIHSSNTTNKEIALNTDADIVLFMFNDLGFTNMISALSK